MVDRPVDRCARRAQTQNGRPPGRPLHGCGRPPGRLTERSQVSVGTGRPEWSTEAWVGRPVSRPTDAF